MLLIVCRRAIISADNLAAVLPDIRVAFGKRLRDLREKAGLSQEELAGRADLHRTYVGSVERGERNVSLVNLARIAHALKLSVSQLLEGVR